MLSLSVRSATRRLRRKEPNVPPRCEPPGLLSRRVSGLSGPDCDSRTSTASTSGRNPSRTNSKAKTVPTENSSFSVAHGHALSNISAFADQRSSRALIMMPIIRQLGKTPWCPHCRGMTNRRLANCLPAVRNAGLLCSGIRGSLNQRAFFSGTPIAKLHSELAARVPGS
jgi:hypothetical protein